MRKLALNNRWRARECSQFHFLGREVELRRQHTFQSLARFTLLALALLLALPAVSPAGTLPQLNWDTTRWDEGTWAPVPEPTQAVQAGAALLTLAALRLGRGRGTCRPASKTGGFSPGPDVIEGE